MENSVETEPKKQEVSSVINKILKAIAIPVGATSGFLVAHTDVRDSAYDTAKNLKMFDELIDQYYPKGCQDIADRKLSRITQSEWLAKASENKKGYSQAVDECMAHMGIGSFINKWNYIKRGSKQRAIMNGLTVGGIAIGAILSVANSKVLSDMFSNDKDKSNTVR